MDKYEYIVNLAEKTAKRVSQNRESWMKFLTSAARIYKYPFKEQLLIYAQWTMLIRKWGGFQWK